MSPNLAHKTVTIKCSDIPFKLIKMYVNITNKQTNCNTAEKLIHHVAVDHQGATKMLRLPLFILI